MVCQSQQNQTSKESILILLKAQGIMNLLGNSFKYYFSLIKAIPKDFINMEGIIQANKNQCRFCFDVLLSKLQGKPMPQLPESEADSEVPIFVTWKKKGQLRGCIGTFSPGRLSIVLPDYAISASMKDPRFPAVTKDEVKDLSVGVSLLINFKQNPDIYGWQVGKHGIIIKGTDGDHAYSGTFLPEVAKEQNWNQNQTLRYLVRKAGFFGKFQEIESRIKLTTYESSKQKMDYEQYIQLKGKNK